MDVCFRLTKDFLPFNLASVYRPTCVLLAIQWCRIAILQATKISVPRLRVLDDTINFAYLGAGEQRRATKFGRQVLCFPSQSSKIWVLLHFADNIARRHFAGYHMINVQTHVNRVHAAVSLIPMQAPPQPGYETMQR